MAFINPIRLFYMATSTGGGTGTSAPTPEELQRQQDFEESVLVMEDTYRSIAITLKDILKQHKEIGEEDKKIAEDYTKDLVKNYRDIAKSSLELLDNSDKLSVGQLRSKEVLGQINKLEAAQVSFATRQAQLAKQGYELTEKEKTQRDEASQQIKLQLSLLNDQLILAKKIEKTSGLTAKIFEGINEIPLLNKFIDLEKVTDAIYENAAKSQSAWKAFGAGISSVTKQLASKLKDPVVQFGLMVSFYSKIIKAASEHNQLLTDTGRALGINRDRTQELYNTSFKYANSARDSFVTTKELIESQIKLNQELGSAVNLGNENAEAFGRLTHFYKLSETSSAKLVQLAKEQGKNGLDILNTTAKTYVTQQKQFGGTMSFNKLLDNVANVSDEIYIRFKGNPEAIAKAVMQADRLGLSLEKVNQIGESLLNFEQSIENELKAELLTGKAINLEKAREYALMGDTEKLTQEIAKQVGNIHQFEKMNVIQRKAYAEAMGMSVQEMAGMLRKQEFEAKLSEEARKSATATLEYADKHGLKMDAALRAQYEQKSLAEEQHEVFKKINEILGKIMQGPMLKFVKMLEGALHVVNNIFEGFSKFTGGALGSALGTAILAAPLLIGATRLLSGGIKAMLVGKRGTTPANPEYVYDVSSGGGGGAGGEIADILGGGFKGKKALVKRFGGAGAARTAMRGLKGGGIAAAIGIGTELVAGQMDEGEGKDVVSGIGQTASYAGTGAMIGSVIPGIGTAVGAIVGGGIGLIKSFFEAEDNRKAREEANEKARKESEKRTTELLEQFASRPVQLNVGGKTILDFNTSQNLYGTGGNTLA